MGIEQSIFGRDIGRLITERSGETYLIGRPTTDPKKVDEANFFFEHGMTREQAADLSRKIAREELDGHAISDLQGDPPEGCNVRGLGPKRALFARYFEWRFGLAKELSDLETKRVEFEALIEAPKATEAEIRQEVIRSAAYLMGRKANDGGCTKRQSLESRLAGERHTAEAAQRAMYELDVAIKRAQLRLAHVNGREDEFITPAIVEIANEIGLGELYLKKVDELRAVLDLINNLHSVAGGYASGFSSFEAKGNYERQFEEAISVRLPCPNIEAVKRSKDKLVLNYVDQSGAFKRLRLSLLMNPRLNARNFVALPK